MLIRINDRTGVPLHSQIAGQLRQAIGRGEIAEGERLPPVRRMAATLDVNMHTVLRAYRELQEDGILDLRQGRGALVRPGGYRRTRELLKLVDDVVTRAKKRGLSPAQVASLVQGQL